MSRKAARGLLTLARLTVTLGAAWLVFSHVDRGLLFVLLARAALPCLVLAGLVLSVQFGVMVWRWQIIIELLGGRAVAGLPLAVALGRSMLVGQLLPSTVGGDVVRTLVLSRQIGLALAARSIICDRITGLAVLIGLVALALPLFAWLVDVGAAFVALAAVSLGGVVACLIVVLTGPGWLSALPWIGTHSAILAGDVQRVFTAGPRGYLVLGLALAIHLFGVLLIYELAQALAAPITLVDCLLIVPPTLLISAIPISLGGWGVREGALAAGFVLVGSGSEAGVATSVLFGLTGPLIGLITEIATSLIRTREFPPKDAA